MTQSKYQRIWISTLVLFSAVRQVFIRRVIAKDFAPIQTLDESLHLVWIHSRGVETAHESAHAGPGDVIHRNVVFLEPFQHADVRESHCSAAFEGYTNFWP